MTVEDAVAGIAATVTAQGLKCTAVLDEADYPTGVQVPPARLRDLEERWTERSGFHGEWNYALLPAPRPRAPEPEPAPPRHARVPHAVLNHPALTGIPAAALDALAADLETRFEARIQQRNHLKRGGERVSTVRTRAVHGNRRLGIADYLTALQLRGYLGLNAQAAGVLLGVDGTTVNASAAIARELLAAARITLATAPPPENPPRTPGELLAYAAAAGIPLTIPENRYTMPDRCAAHAKRTTRGTPETTN
jgi:hypothetical protein